VNVENDMTYTVSWRRRPAFGASGLVERQCDTLAEARRTMAMAAMTELDFVPLQIVDSAGRSWSYDLADPDMSDQDYVDNGFEFVEEWPLRSVDDGEHSPAPQPLTDPS
jgi:hypothetical protein